MTIRAIVVEADTLSLPQGTTERLQLCPGFAISVDLSEANPEAAPYDAVAYAAALRKHAGTMQDELARRGYASTDELMDEIRPKD